MIMFRFLVCLSVITCLSPTAAAKQMLVTAGGQANEIGQTASKESDAAILWWLDTSEKALMRGVPYSRPLRIIAGL